VYLHCSPHTQVRPCAWCYRACEVEASNSCTAQVRHGQPRCGTPSFHQSRRRSRHTRCTRSINSNGHGISVVSFRNLASCARYYHASVHRTAPSLGGHVRLENEQFPKPRRHTSQCVDFTSCAILNRFEQVRLAHKKGLQLTMA
jgi:hypothetical protein